VTKADREREQLILLLAALSDPSAASRLADGDPGLLELARHHRLTPLLSAQRGAALPPGLAEAFRRDRVVTTARNMMLGQAAEECVQALQAAGLETVVLKGLDYEARLYSAPGSRPTADVDLLVANQARRAAFEILDGLGFEPRAAAPGFDDADYHEVAWTRQGVEVDLHMALAPFARCRIDYGAVWREAEPLRIGVTETRALARPHAAIFHALHMAIDHFAVPAIYLVDLSRLVSTAEERVAVEGLAAAWHCRRPVATAVALTSAFMPDWPARTPVASRAARRVLEGYGATAPIPRREQLLRKLLHFDSAADAAAYVRVQSRRNLHEIVERRLGRSARQRLGLAH
jgi:hypothetical protein